MRPGNERAPPVLLLQVLRGFAGSPDWTRTNNPAINSRMLCQLSYGGMLVSAHPGERGNTSKVPADA